jgi:hypothetical protein
MCYQIISPTASELSYNNHPIDELLIGMRWSEWVTRASIEMRCAQ